MNFCIRHERNGVGVMHSVIKLYMNCQEKYDGPHILILQLWGLAQGCQMKTPEIPRQKCQKNARNAGEKRHLDMQIFDRLLLKNLVTLASQKKFGTQWTVCWICSSVIVLALLHLGTDFMQWNLQEISGLSGHCFDFCVFDTVRCSSAQKWP